MGAGRAGERAEEPGPCLGSWVGLGTGEGNGDERTLLAWHCHEVSVPKKQRLEEVNYQGHSQPRKGEQGGPKSSLGVLPL